VISRVETYQGVALARLCRGIDQDGITIRVHDRSSFIIGGSIGIYVKYSAMRLGLWQFSFRIEHQKEIDSLADQCDDVFIVLVCGIDGVACLKLDEYRRLLDEDAQPGEWIKVSRRPRQKYTVTGSDLRRGLKIGDNEYPSKILSSFKGSNLGSNSPI
jgi:hypothetical protein